MADASSPQRVILVVEDEPGIRDGLQMLLELEGYDVVVASNGLQAFEVLAAKDCDLVITDQMMPRMDGITFLGRLREQTRYRALPVIMISAVPRPPEAIGPLADAFIGKPFEAPRLLQTIQRLLASGRTAPIA
ncbi:response regulator [Cognatilysobacter segetis]|uniref:response regulator n=1 Tax=Cognatilysobacter segetis TaxID=2492394 RepID=UPI0013905E2A|nr:response regulator [Lysobacter segetis]